MVGKIARIDYNTEEKCYQCGKYGHLVEKCSSKEDVVDEPQAMDVVGQRIRRRENVMALGCRYLIVGIRRRKSGGMEISIPRQYCDGVLRGINLGCCALRMAI
ncbi:hypothetical protein V6N13_008160 [Hibiscus sabdariffa]|uniref:CCHC-type domain-containing protein n=1 Tax=Hibiscus sabdariffa TaxID=183260 RepID=A0ABR2ECT4_9ROSI